MSGSGSAPSSWGMSASSAPAGSTGAGPHPVSCQSSPFEDRQGPSVTCRVYRGRGISRWLTRSPDLFTKSSRCPSVSILRLGRTVRFLGRRGASPFLSYISDVSTISGRFCDILISRRKRSCTFTITGKCLGGSTIELLIRQDWGASSSCPMSPAPSLDDW